MTSSKPIRIAKRVADAGLCSRREAERLIDQGRVAVNGDVITTPALTVLPADTVHVDGEALPAPSRPRLWRYHKPIGLVTTHRDPEERPTVFSRLPADMPRVVSVGRLDINSEGLLLLTTSGELARHLEHPATGMLRRYRVRVRGKPEAKALRRLQDGITIEGVAYRGIHASLEPHHTGGSNYWLQVHLREGKNREIRHVFEHLGYPVNRLIRTAYGPHELGDLPPRQVAEVVTGSKPLAISR